MNYRKILSLLTLLVFDVVTLIISYVIAYFLRTRVLSLFIHDIVAPLPFRIFILRFYLVIPYILVFLYEALYTKRFVFWQETRKLWKSNTIATALVMIVLYVTRAFVVSRAIIVLAYFVNFILLPLQRNLIKQLLHKLHLWTKNVLIISSKSANEKLIKEINRHPILGYKPIAHLESPASLALQRGESDSIHLNNLLTTNKIDSIIIDAESLDQSRILEIYEQAEGKVEDIMVIPALSQLQTAGVEIIEMETTILMKFRYNLLRSESRIAKRILDLSIAGIGFIALLPAIVIIAMLTKISSQGPIFITQQRLGKNKKLFPCYKFRTMYLDAPKRLEKLFIRTPETKIQWEKFLKITDDPRVTPLGRLLRRTSLDELPQLWNVIKGEMSLVGPRPYLPHEVEDMHKRVGIITRVQPGISGLWQVSGRSQLTFTERLQLDEYYVKNWSIWTDIVILVKTIKVLFKAEGAF